MVQFLYTIDVEVVVKLTEMEKKYCEYVFLKQAKSIKVGLGIAFGIALGFVYTMFIYSILTNAQMEMKAFGVTSVFMTILLTILYTYKCGTYSRMYKELRLGSYKVVARTTILKKEVLRIRRSNFPIYSFICQGIDERVSPLSMDLFFDSHEGDEITVVDFKAFPRLQGIVFSKSFEVKVLEWDKKRKC